MIILSPSEGLSRIEFIEKGNNTEWNVSVVVRLKSLSKSREKGSHTQVGGTIEQLEGPWARLIIGVRGHSIYNQSLNN